VKKRNALMIGILTIAGIVSSVAILAMKTTYKPAMEQQRMKPQKREDKINLFV